MCIEPRAAQYTSLYPQHDVILGDEDTAKDRNIKIELVEKVSKKLPFKTESSIFLITIILFNMFDKTMLGLLSYKQFVVF